jgi:carbonic anhydrase
MQLKTMSRARLLLVSLALLVPAVSPACAHSEEAKAEAHGAAGAKSAGSAAHPVAAHGAGSALAAASGASGAHGAQAVAAPGHGAHVAGSAEPSARPFPVPFVVDSRPELDAARGLLAKMWADNAAFARTSGPAHFAPFRDGQKPRATLVTCSDSRVQSPALLALPENELFTIRDIGNQIETAEGSVEYGVEHLKTPVLLIVGHTGCGAVKAVLEGAEAGPAVKHELGTLHVSKKAKAEPAVWADAVIEHVHGEVAVALKMFPELVRDGRLTVIGAVYDFRDDLGFGAGKLVLVDVNGQSDPTKLDAFLLATSK